MVIASGEAASSNGSGDVIDTALHDVLFAFQEAHDCDDGIAVVVDGINVAAVSDGAIPQLSSGHTQLSSL